MREAFESESRSTGKDRLLITMAVPASLEYAGKVGITIEDNLDLLQKYSNSYITHVLIIVIFLYYIRDSTLKILTETWISSIF